MEKDPGINRVRVPKQRRPAPRRLTMRVENEVGGPTSLPGLSVQGIARNVRIAHNYMAGRRPDFGLDQLPPQPAE
jgi:hypothetical protein